MHKSEWIEERDRDYEMYDRSILSHDDDRTDSMKDYEFSIMHRDDDEDYKDSFNEGLYHFLD